jgi:hypothetical protein
MHDLFEEFWRLSLEKFEAAHGPLETADGSEVGKPFLRPA